MCIRDSNIPELELEFSKHVEEDYNIVNTFRLTFGYIYGEKIGIVENRQIFVNRNLPAVHLEVDKKDLDRNC